MTTATGYAEMFEWEDGNPDNEDRAGYTVTISLGSNKIRIAGKKDEPIGVVGGDNTSVAVISGTSPNEWHGKHKRDAFNRLLWERQLMVEWVENGFRHWYEHDRLPEFVFPPADAKYYGVWPDTNKPLMREIQTNAFAYPTEEEKIKKAIPYLPRTERKEWAIVVLLGRTIVRDDAVCHINWKRLSQSNEHKVSEWLIR